MLDSLFSLATVSSVVAFLSSLAGQAVSLAPGVIIWDQYVDLVEWSLNSLAEIFSSGGLAIIAFTIIIKTILMPLTVKSIRSSKAMQDLQPRIKELQKKYGKDRQRLSQETMALYSAYGVNPMAGCLPMLLQIPIFFGLYQAITQVSRSDAVNWSDGFLWLESLDAADPYRILPILAGVFQFVQTRMMRPAGQGKVTDPQQVVMNQMMNFMPLMVILFGWTFAAGPVLYWATQSVYSVIQQWFITGWGSLRDWLPWLPEMPEHRRLGYHPPRDLDDVVVVSGEAGAARPQKGIQGWLMKRMEDAQKQANERQQATRQQRDQRGGTASSSARANRQAVSATSDEDEATDEEPTAPPASAGRRTANRRSTSYQDRVDAATKFGGLGNRAVASPSGEVAGNGRADGRATGRGGDAVRRSTAPRRPRKKRR